MEYDHRLFLLRRRLLVLCFTIRMFLMGVEYSVIFPSFLLYMKTLNASNAFMGLVVAAYPLAAMISLPIVGHIYDKTKRTKELLIALNLLQIIGNIIYALPFSVWLPLWGRFLAGLGDGFTACAMGEITYAYDKSYRTGIISIMEMTRILGLVIGPAFSFLIGTKVHYLLEWRLDYTTIPGLIMAFIWLFYEIFTIFFVFNVSKEMKKQTSFREEEASNMLCGEDVCGCTMDNMCGIEHSNNTEEENDIFDDKMTDESNKDKRNIKNALKAVSYTHLTLPTILLV